ncbi:bifunctional DNA-formamidopyrimidine glycosylase/DNA-(apurinic or apyrimidinic site) lyase [soil metagenome]
MVPVMPELPEVETVMRGLRGVLEGRRIFHVALARDGLRFPFPADFAARLAGRTVTRLERRAKYILAFLDSNEVLIIHLGMTGRFTIFAPRGVTQNLGDFYFEEGANADGAGKHDHVRFDLDGGTRVVFTDPRRFGLMDLVAEETLWAHRLLDRIGVEPLGNEFSAETLTRAFRGKNAPLKAALLDQTIIAGLGNIYVCEALHRAGLSPKRKAGTLARKKGIDVRVETLVRHIRDVLNEAIRAGGSTLKDYAAPDGLAGAYQQRFAVYDREGKPCFKPGCGGTIRRIVQAGRSTFYCPRCQR